MVTEERVVNLEVTLARFIEQTTQLAIEAQASTALANRRWAEFQARAEADRQRWLRLQEEANQDRQRLAELQAQAHQDRTRADEDRRRLADEDRRHLLELQKQADQERRRMDEDRLREERDRQRAEQDRKDFNRRLAELSDSRGTLIEDMVAPRDFLLAQAVFEDEEAQSSAIRVRRRHPVQPGESMELDLLAVGPTKVLVVEAKHRIDPAKVIEYREKLSRFPEFFPELGGKTLLAAVASVYLEPSVVTFLNRQKVYGIAMGDEVMGVVNLGQF